MLRVVTAEEMRELDRVTIEEIGIPGAVLMETAGRAVAEAVSEELAAMPRGGPVVVMCGAGGNGGDGFVVARVLREHGVEAVVLLAAAAEQVKGDAALHLLAYQRSGGPVVAVDTAAKLAAEEQRLRGAAVLVDAVFGTGLARSVSGHYRAVVDAINRVAAAGPVRVVAVDIPSGMSANTGLPLGVQVYAHRTVTMAFLKVGLAAAPGFAYAGRVTVAEIGIPRSLAIRSELQSRVALLETADLAAMLPRVSPLDHKGVRGHVLAIAGSPGKRGAARLTALAALRAGAGLVTVAGPGADSDTGLPDPVMSAHLDPGGEKEASRALERAAAGKRAIAIGPGMDTGAGGRALVRAALAELEVGMVLDADALNHLAQELDAVAAARSEVVLTPHPGEAGRLLGKSAAEVEADRLAAVRELAQKTRAVCVLKGARTLVCDGGGDRLVTINPSGGPALATAGSGDVLTGVIAALLARGLPAVLAAQLGVYVHGRAGERAGTQLGVRSVTASDVTDAISGAFRELGD
jgi:NAD(P)H-hydrate epimerase